MQLNITPKTFPCLWGRLRNSDSDSDSEYNFNTLRHSRQNKVIAVKQLTQMSKCHLNRYRSKNLKFLLRALIQSDYLEENVETDEM